MSRLSKTNFQYLNNQHVLHFHRQGFLSIKVECLCGWELKGRFTAEELLENETARHIRQVMGRQANVEDLR